jgi:Redoxin
MSNLYKRIELLANIAIIVVAILLGVLLVQHYLLPTPPNREAVERAQLKPGTKLSLSGVDWGKSSRTLLMVLSTNCRYCTESAPFYQRIAQEKAGHGDVSLVAVLPQSANEATEYLTNHGIVVDDIKQASSVDISVRGTPTLIIVDRAGSVVDSWVGKLPAEKENEVLSRLLEGR